MVFSKREQQIAIGLAVVVSGVIGWMYVAEPFMQRQQAIAKQTAEVNQQLDLARQLFNRESRLNPVWNDLKAGGLTADGPTATGQLNDAVSYWMRESGVTLSALKPLTAPRDKDGKFQVITIQFEGIGNMRSLGQLTSKLESALIPIRINEMQIRPLKPGIDNLKIEMTVSTLSMASESDKPAKKL